MIGRKGFQIGVKLLDLPAKGFDFATKIGISTGFNAGCRRTARRNLW